MNKPGDKNYVNPDKPQPCQTRGERQKLVTDEYRDNYDEIEFKPLKGGFPWND